MFNIYAAAEYVLPPPQIAPDIPAVASVRSKKGLGRNRDRRKEESSKKKSAFKDLLEKEVKEEFDTMGCFFETRV
ncbi:MAG: hypothetical protein K6E49_00080 [Lachnospiraceae bacterium]|nr:hypothetical protein [Lachnospiraceae bacterium]